MLSSYHASSTLRRTEHTRPTKPILPQDTPNKVEAVRSFKERIAEIDQRIKSLQDQRAYLIKAYDELRFG